MFIVGTFTDTVANDVRTTSPELDSRPIGRASPRALSPGHGALSLLALQVRSRIVPSVRLLDDRGRSLGSALVGTVPAPRLLQRGRGPLVCPVHVLL